MATPMSGPTLARVLRAAGLKVVEERGWLTNNRNHKGPWGPVHGVMIHHTVTSGTRASVNLCFNGHSTLPGPLCHGVIDKDGTVYLVGNGRANHAGSGDDDVLAAVIAERSPLPPDNEANKDGNRHFYGFECVNLGNGKDPWPAAQLLAIEKASAAICKHHNWSQRSVIGHLEWQPGKVDPRGFTMDSMRTRIGKRLSSPKPDPKPEPPKEIPVQYSQLTRQTPLTVPAGEAKKIYFDANDVYDEPNQHGAGGYTAITGKRAYHGVVSLWLPDAGAELSVLAVHELADGTTSTSSFDDVLTDRGGVRAVPIAGMLPVDRKLHVQVRNDGVAPLTVTRAELRLFSESRG